MLFRSPTEPVTVVADDFDGNGSWDPIMCYYMDGKSWPMPSRDDMMGQIPGLKKKFLHYTDYAKADLNAFFDEKKLAAAFKARAVRTLSSVLLNGGKGQFTFQDLPVQAQFAPVFALVSNGAQTGPKDLILAGNLERARVKFGRMDANCGLVLRADAQGKFSALEPRKSGLGLRGEVRSAVRIRTVRGERWVFGVNGKGVVVVGE